MYVHNPISRTRLFAGSHVKTLMSGKDTDGRFCMLEFRGPPGRSTPLHMHDNKEETVHVLEGELEVTVDGRAQSVRTGETVLLPRSIPHQIATKSIVDARYIVVCTPAGFDQFVAAPQPKMAPSHPARRPQMSMLDSSNRLDALASRYSLRDCGSRRLCLAS